MLLKIFCGYIMPKYTLLMLYAVRINKLVICRFWGNIWGNGRCCW